MTLTPSCSRGITLHITDRRALFFLFPDSPVWQLLGPPFYPSFANAILEPRHACVETYELRVVFVFSNSAASLKFTKLKNTVLGPS